MQTKPIILTAALALSACHAVPSEKQPSPANTPESTAMQPARQRTRAEAPSVPLPPHQAIKDIVYQTVGGKERKLDLYLPANASAQTPLLVWVHGGAWMRGSKEDFPSRNSRLAAALLNEGYALASVDYRLSGEAAFPAPYDDINAAVAFLNAHKTYPFDRNRVVMAGRSAGAHLAALSGVTGANHFKPKAIVGFFGVYDLILLDHEKDRGKDGTPEAKFLGEAPAANPKKAAQASPLAYVSAATPPVILLHGTQDTTVPPSQSSAMKAALDKAGVISELHLAQGARHSDPVFDTEEYVAKVMAFLRRHVR